MVGSNNGKAMADSRLLDVSPGVEKFNSRLELLESLGPSLPR